MLNIFEAEKVVEFINNAFFFHAFSLPYNKENSPECSGLFLLSQLIL